MPDLDFSKVKWDTLSNLPGSSSLGGVMDSAIKEEPNAYASNLKLANEAGISVDAVAGDPAAIKSNLNYGNVNWDTMSVRNPRTAEFLTTFENAVVAQDDIPMLESLEDLWTGVKRTFQGAGESTGLAFKQQLAGAKILAADSAFELVRRGMSPQLAQNLSRLGIRSPEEFKAAEESFIGELTGQVEQIQARREEITPEGLNLIQQGVRSGYESLVNMAPGFAAMILTRNSAAMLTPIGVQTGLSSYGDARAEGLDADTAFNFAAIDAAIEVGTELLPTGTLEKILTGSSTGKLGKEAIRFLIQEMGTEQIATLGQSLNAYNFGLDEQLEQAEGAGEITKIMLERAAVTAIATVVAGGAQVGIVTGIRKGVDAITNQQQVQEDTTAVEQATLSELNRIAENSTTRERSPEKFSQFIEDMDGDQDSHVFIDSAQLALYLKENADQVTEDPALILLAEKLQATSTSGEDVSIPVADFATVIAATPHFEALRDNMVLNQESISPFRQDAMNKETESVVERLVTEAQENVEQYVEAQNIFLNVRDQMVDTGRLSEQAANTMAQMVPAWATIFAKRNNITIEEAYTRTGLLVVGPETGKLASLEEQSQLLAQDFGDIELSQEVEIKETGNTVTLTESAQKVHDRVIKRQNVVKKVQECLNGA